MANTTNITFHGIDSEAPLILLDKEGICASSGSACLADSDEPSHVVKAMKPDSAAARQMLRFSLDVANTADEIKTALVRVQGATAAIQTPLERCASAIFRDMKLEELKTSFTPAERARATHRLLSVRGLRSRTLLTSA